MTATLRRALKSYLSLRRGLGMDMKKQEPYLQQFVRFLESRRASVVTIELALRWATTPSNATAATWAQRLGHVRRFAEWLSTSEPLTEVPPRELIAARHRRRPPYIYADGEIYRIVGAARKLVSDSGLRAHTFATLFGLLASTGLRLGEAVALDCDDVDIRAGILTIRRAKFGKSRFVPVHDSTLAALRYYLRQRDRLRPHSGCPAFFLSERGERVTANSAEYNFAVVSKTIGLRPPGPRRGHGPRLHDMRHWLAVKTLVRWYREGRDVERELPKLSTYLGHVHVADTYWYLEAVPELLRLATERVTAPTEIGR